MKELGGLAARMPVWATFMVFFTMASVGLPGTNGFISEFLCLIGAFQASDQWLAGGGGGGGFAAGLPGKFGFAFGAIAGVGMIVAAMYLLYMVGKVVWGPLVEPHGHGHGHDHGHAASDEGHEAAPLPADLTAREIGVLLPLAVLCLLFGLYPKPLTQALDPSVIEMTRWVDGARSRAAEPVRSRLGVPSAAPVRERPPVREGHP
jgi:NADH-quinone oxidoreductase subunit M